jgi:Holliday junction DNA helicase RuvA
LFIQLIGVNGVGASTARMMLSSMQPGELRSAIASGNTGALERIKGIGRKSAERIVLELREKIVKNVPESTSSGFKYNTLDQDALNALVALGIPRNVGETAIKKVKSSTSGEPDLETLIKKSLQLI